MGYNTYEKIVFLRIYANQCLFIADPNSISTKRTAPSTSAPRKTTTTSTICTPGEQSCISIKFHKTCQTADPKNDESVIVLANGKCNRIGTEDYRYYTLECGGDGIAGVFNCDSTCQNCQVEKLDVALDGQCITKPEVKQHRLDFRWSVTSTSLCSRDVSSVSVVYVSQILTNTYLSFFSQIIWTEGPFKKK